MKQKYVEKCLALLIAGMMTVSSLSMGSLPVLAAGGTAWSGYDLWKAREQLPAELTALLLSVIRDCQDACRKEVLK